MDKKTNTNNSESKKFTKMITGKLVSAYIMARSDKDPVPRCTMNIIPDDDVWTDIDDLYADVSKKFVPQWAKDKDHMMLRSTFDVPVMLPDGNKVTFDDFVKRGLIDGAEIKVKCTFAPETETAGCAIYPSALKVLVDGKEKDPFEGM